MANRYRVWAQRVLCDLREMLGNCCARCGTFGEPEDFHGALEFDCIEPRGDTHHRWETNRRAVFYRREYAAGNLQLLCFDCHRAKSVSEHPRYADDTF